MKKNICFTFLCAVVISATAVFAFGQKSRLISDIQGEANVSPYYREAARVTGIVTGRTRNGFFIQTPDDKVDSNPKTSEGIFVFTKKEAPSEATVGNLVSVSGRIDEFKPKGDDISLTITQISMEIGRDSISVESKGNALPKPIELSSNDFAANMFDQLERYESMRVAVKEFTVTSPTGRGGSDTAPMIESNGVFYGVLKGTPRAFREPGFLHQEYLTSNEKVKETFKKQTPKLTLFDGNPETIRVETTGILGGQPYDVSANTVVTGITGIMYYARRAYTIFTDPSATLTATAQPKAKPLPKPTDRQIYIAGMNLENYFDDQDDPAIKEDIIRTETYQRKTAKISKAIRNYLQMPDVIGLVEAEGLDVLKKLAAQIDADAEAEKQTPPKYQAYLLDGNDGRGIDVGILVKSTRVKVLETSQIDKELKYKTPEKGEEIFVHDRPSLVAKIAVDDTKTGKPFEFTLILNHLKSFNNYDQEYVRLKKKLQAESIAKYVNARQKANPNERILLLGDFNAYQFNDGIVDVMGTLRGQPAAADTVLYPSEDLVERNLVNLVDMIQPKERYSYIYDGNAQVLDHALISEPFADYVYGFGYGRLNADFAETYRNDGTRVERYSDHDAPLIIASFDSKATAQPAPTPKP